MFENAHIKRIRVIQARNPSFFKDEKNILGNSKILSGEGIALTSINTLFDEVKCDAILILTWKIETSAPKFVEPITKDCKPPKQQKVLR